MKSIKSAVEDYLKQRKSLGYELRLASYALRNFADYLEKQNYEYVTIDLALSWSRQPAEAQQATWSRKLSMIRGFAKYHYTFDTRTEVPPVNLIPCHYKRPNPYIYKLTEIRRLMDASKNLPSKTGLRSQTYYTLLGMLTVTALRIKEVILLEHEDVDLDSRMITIKKGKYGKYRIIPISSSCVQALKKYIVFRDSIFPVSQSNHFFLSESGNKLAGTTVNSTFRRICSDAGVTHMKGKAKPRLHDLRHTFAVNTLIEWYQKGEDVQQKLPSLSTFLGHVHTTDTYWYLTGVPELLCVVSQKLENLKLQ